jgi:hypothetical protein
MLLRAGKIGQQGTHYGYADYMIHGNVFQRAPRHFSKRGLIGVLHDGYTSEAFDPPQTGASIVQGATQDDTDDSLSMSDGC